MPRLFGQRIMLREYQKEDLLNIREWVNDPDTVKNLDDLFIYPHTMNMTEQFLDSVLNNSCVDEKHFIIADIKTGAYIGQSSLMHINWRSRVAETGMVIAHQEDRGQGYGKEAMKLLLDFAFNQMNLHRVELRVKEFNVQGYRCYLGCGFKEEGRKRKSFYANGSYLDVILMGVLKDEFGVYSKSGTV